MRRAKDLATRLDSLHEAMAAAKRARDGAQLLELRERLERLNSVELYEFEREMYLAAIREKNAAGIESFEKYGMQWLLQDDWKEEGVRRFAFTQEEVAEAGSFADGWGER